MCHVNKWFATFHLKMMSLMVNLKVTCEMNETFEIQVQKCHKDPVTDETVLQTNKKGYFLVLFLKTLFLAFNTLILSF